MSSESFRRHLQHEARQWQSEGLISPDQYRQIADRYQFATLDTDARNRFTAILVILGGILLGIGVITFVASNWQSIPRGGKVVLLLTLLVGSNSAGFYLWRSPHLLPSRMATPDGPPSGESAEAAATPEGSPAPTWQRRLGHALLIFGALTLGANLALMGQIFHQSGSAFGLCLVWGLGVTAMAYGLRLASLGAVAALLLGIGYWATLHDTVFGSTLSPLRLLLANMPLVAGVLLVPLAYWCRSRLLFGMAAIGVVSSLQMVLVASDNRTQDTFGLVPAVSCTLPVALLWAYDDVSWRATLSRLTPPDFQGWRLDRPFRPVARAIAVILLSGIIYYLSFNRVWQEYTRVFQGYTAPLPRVIGTLLSNPSIVVLGLMALGFWMYLGWPRIGQQWRLTRTDGWIAALLGVTGLCLIWDESVASIWVTATVLFNGLLFLLSVGILREGLGNGDRKQFWWGLALLVLHVLSRVFEYDTGLLVKSMTFLLCGIAVIAIGLWFERYVRSLARVTASADIPPSPETN